MNKNEYAKAYYQKNKDRIKDKMKEYYKLNRETIIERNSRYNQDNIQQYTKYQAEYYKRHKQIKYKKHCIEGDYKPFTSIRFPEGGINPFALNF
jgi:hypothetical protein